MSYYIKSLCVTGPDKAPSLVEFIDGLNIIYGPSECGKSYISNCIDYLFGAKNVRIPSELGYTAITGTIVTDKGEITIKRAFYTKTSDIEVISTDFRVPQCTYSAAKGGKKKPGISSLWLRLIGIEEAPQIIASSKMSLQSLTWGTFSHMFLIPEKTVFQEESILLPLKAVSIVPFKTALLYLLSAQNHIPADFEKDTQKRAIRREAVAKFIQEQLKAIDERKKALFNQKTLSPEAIQTKIDMTLAEITSTESEMSACIQSIAQIANQIVELNNECAEKANLKDKYESLRTQYASDLRRITFIAEGEMLHQSVRQPIKCPFCNGTMTKRDETSCSEAARMEIERLLPQIQDLEHAEQELIAAQEELAQNISALEDKRRTETEHLQHDLEPRIEALRADLKDFEEAVSAAKETSVMTSYEELMKQRLVDISQDRGDDCEFDLQEYFNDDFCERLQPLLREMLKSCNFVGWQDAAFDISSFDLRIGSKEKQTFGKGYRALLNTVLAITLQKYVELNGVYQPHFMLVDSPILSLKERGDEKAPDSMKSALFQYMVEHQEERQTIIIENDIPAIDYKQTNMIHFTKTDGEGRYGFLVDVK